MKLIPKTHKILSLSLLFSTILMSDYSFAAKLDDNNLVIQDHIDHLQKEYQKLNEKVDFLEHQVKILQNEVTKQDSANNSQTEHLRENNQNLNSSNSNNEIIDDLKNNSQNITHASRVEDDAKNPPFIMNDSPIIPSDTLHAEDKFKPVSEKTDYELALASLKEGRIEDANSRFKSFIEYYPESKFISNAYFWYGESFLRKDDYKAASIYFLKCYKQDKSGPKAPDSLLKLVMSLSQTGKKVEACSILRKIEKEFPSRSTSVIKRGQELKAKLKCG